MLSRRRIAVLGRRRMWRSMAPALAAFVAASTRMPQSSGTSRVCTARTIRACRSLLRYFYCEKRVLRLGTSLMALLRRWAQAEGLSPEEHELAVKVHAVGGARALEREGRGEAWGREHGARRRPWCVPHAQCYGVARGVALVPLKRVAMLSIAVCS